MRNYSKSSLLSFNNDHMLLETREYSDAHISVSSTAWHRVAHTSHVYHCNEWIPLSTLTHSFTHTLSFSAISIALCVCVWIIESVGCNRLVAAYMRPACRICVCIRIRIRSAYLDCLVVCANATTSTMCFGIFGSCVLHVCANQFQWHGVCDFSWCPKPMWVNWSSAFVRYADAIPYVSWANASAEPDFNSDLSVHIRQSWFFVVDFFTHMQTLVNNKKFLAYMYAYKSVVLYSHLRRIENEYTQPFSQSASQPDVCDVWVCELILLLLLLLYMLTFSSTCHAHRNGSVYWKIRKRTASMENLWLT